MLKWTKQKDSDSMSRAGKFRPNGPASADSNSNGKITMPSNTTTTSPSPSVHNNNNSSSSNNNNNGIHSLKQSAQNGSTFSQGQGSEFSDDASTSEPDGPISLDVLLPSGQHTDILVDYNTPMLDLLVSLAGKCRLNPTGLSLQLLDPDTGRPLTYKPNQTIGSLGGREVRLIPKDDGANKAKAKGRQEKPFEMTHRFTMNLPRGQKTVVRVSPLITLGQLMTTVCEDKSLDLRRHVLQIPGQPGVKVDLASTVQELGLHELNLVAVGLQDPRSHMVSMPDLSKPPPSSTAPPSYMPMAGELKKKRGFLSFLSKNKDKKYRTQNMETSSTTSHMARGPYPPSSRQATTPPAQRRELTEAPHRPYHPESRPKSMFVAAAAPKAPADQTLSLERSKNPTQHKHQLQQQLDQPLDVTAGTAKKKRRAPAPPGPSSSSSTSLPSPPSMVPPEERSQTHNGGHSISLPPTSQNHQDQEEQEQNQQQQQQQVSRTELLSRLHSRNSSDSSGYHELTLSGADSPEAPSHHEHSNQQQAVAKLKTSIDTTSIESGPDGSAANGDSGVHDLSPTRVSPIEEVTERPDHAVSVSERENMAGDKLVVATTAVTVAAAAAPSGKGGKKKRKAPAPPAPTPSDSSAAAVPAPDSITATAATKTDANPGPPTERQLAQGLDVEEEPSPREASTPRQYDEDRVDVPTDQPELGNPDSSVDAAAAAGQTDNKPQKYATWDEPEGDEGEDADEINSAFDINAILDGVVFDEEPRPMELQVAGSLERDMVMEETGSIISETMEQVEVARHERPCAFIPPPPPDEPPPPEVEPVENIASLTRKPDPILVDKGTGVNDDNTSLAPSSAKSSPGAEDRRRRASFTSMASVDTIEGLSMDFEQAIQMGEESLDLSVDDVTVPASYKNEMALFVERMSKMAVETSSGGSGHLDDSVSSLSLPASDVSDTGSVIQHVRTGSQDSRESGSDGGRAMGSLSKSKGTLPMSEEISVPVETVPPPPEFKDDSKTEDKVAAEKEEEEEEEEEYFTETVEELIIPLTPHGYDFSAAQQVSAETVVSEQATPRGEREGERVRSGSTGVFRAEPVSIAPVPKATVSSPRPPTPPVLKQQTVPDASVVTASPPSSAVQQNDKEEFVLTTEDLSNVSFLPPKPKAAKITPLVSNPERSVSSGFVSSTALVLEKHGIQKESPRTPRSPDASAFTSTEPEDPVLETKPLSTLQYLPTMRVVGRTDTAAVPAFSDDSRSEDSNADPSLDPLVNKLTPRLLVDSSSQPVTSKQKSKLDDSQRSSSPSTTSFMTTPTVTTYSVSSNDSQINHDRKDQRDNSVDTSGNEKVAEVSLDSSTEMDPQEALATQYAALQAQFAQWQTQLSQNQTLLAAQTSPGTSSSSQAAPGIQAEQWQQLSSQVLAQQQMMQQLQQTMWALQQQQPQQAQGKDLNSATAEISTPADSTLSEAVPPPPAPPSGVSNSPPPPPPPPPAPASNAPQSATTSKGIPKVRTLDSPRPAKPAGRQSRFEPVLDPREELMLAIRGFKGREGLRSVSVQQTKWVHSNR